MLPPAETKLTPEQLEAKLDHYAQKITNSGLAVPAAFFLELHLPLGNVLHTGALVLEPITAPLFGAERISYLRELLADPKNIERLLELLELKSKNKQEYSH